MFSPKQHQRIVYRGGANLYITNLCSGRCSYCCVKEWITDTPKDAQYLSLRDLDKIIMWLKESEIGFVQLIGGEPMLHPYIEKIVEKLRNQGIFIRTILTNCLGDTEVYQRVINKLDTIWLVNVNHPSSYTKEEWEKINRNLELLRWKGEDKLISEEPFDIHSLSLQLAVNFYKPNLDYSYIIELAQKYRCSHIRYAPSHPSAGESNVHVPFEELERLKPTLMSFVKDSVSAGVKPGLECVLPPCIFTTTEWRYLILFTEAIKTLCQPDLEIFPDLSVNTCVSTLGIVPSYKIGEMSAQEMIQRFLLATKHYKECVPSYCEGCELLKTKDCQGYCLKVKAKYC
jgi:cyclic pyranopterin phosphate synthase